MAVSAEVTSSQDDDFKNSILDRVASSNAFFKSQQLGDKDLTFDEKRKIAESLLENNVSIFLQRYWNFLDVSDVIYFEPHRSDYQVNFYLCEIMKLHDDKTRIVRVKNRRYEALRTLISEGSYFSESEMKRRNPLMYEQLIGQYLSDSERAAASRQDVDYDSFSGFLMKCFEKNQEDYLMKLQQDEDDAVVEEQDDDESESEMEEADVTANNNPEPPTDEEKEMMRNEFKNIMYENFLAGKDLDFDYSTVDNNVEYDSLDQREIDEEEKYFDED